MRQIISILLSFILLASHTNLTIGTHYCGGENIETKIIFGETHLGCGMMDMDEPCDVIESYGNNETSFSKGPCCQNKFQTIYLSDDFVNDAIQSTSNVDFALAFMYSTINFDIFQRSNTQFYTEYISPPLEKDIPVLFQTFLI